MNRKKNIQITVLVMIVSLCAVCFAPTVISLRERRQTLRNDIAALEDIAKSLGYNGQDRIYLYRSFDWNGVDGLTIAFWTPLSFEQVVERLIQSGYISTEDKLTPVANPDFLEDDINRYGEGYPVAFDGFYAPVVREWGIIKGQRKILHFTCGGLNIPGDRWVINNHHVSGSIVRIRYSRIYQSISTFTQDMENAGIVQDIHYIKTSTPSITTAPKPAVFLLSHVVVIRLACQR